MTISLRKISVLIVFLKKIYKRDAKNVQSTILTKLIKIYVLDLD